MIITIDGPAGSGKSTVAKLLALYLEYDFLDTGAMYRSIALLGLRNHVPWNDPQRLTELARAANIDFHSGRPFLNGEDVSEQVRTVEVTQHTKYAAENPGIRMLLVPKQRAIAEKTIAEGGKGIVSEGRDQGTIVFPDAKKKIYLTASPEERARRRLGELEMRGEKADFQTLLQQINARDEGDMSREIAPLRIPENAFVFSTDGLRPNDVVEKLVAYCTEISEENA